MSLPRLASRQLSALPASALDSGAKVVLPDSGRTDAQPGVVHLGLGAFHRAHQALVYERLLAGGDSRWGVVGVAMRSTQLADDLAAQDGLYAVQIADAGSQRWEIPGALVRTCVAARERQQVVDAIAAPAARWITLTVTEKGYTPDLAALIVDGLERRKASGLPGVTVASCDNLSDNGRKLQALCMSDAAARDPALAAWIEARCAFPNSMVDRIVPAATPAQYDAAAAALGVEDRGALSTEAFWEWVVERRMADPSDAALLAQAGVTVVEDVKPFEDAKLRMLNGSHSTLAYLGAVIGYETVDQAMADEQLARFVPAMLAEEVEPTLARPDLPAYRAALMARFGNRALKHRLQQIAMDGSQKIPQRLLGSLRQQRAAGVLPRRLCFALAGWFRYLAGEDEAGCDYAIADPLAAPLQAAATRTGGSAARVDALLALGAVFDAELASDIAVRNLLAQYLEAIRTLGVKAALRTLQLDGLSAASTHG